MSFFDKKYRIFQFSFFCRIIDKIWKAQIEVMDFVFQMHFPYLSNANDGIFENTVLPKCTKSSRLSEVVTSDFFKWEVKMALACEECKKGH